MARIPENVTHELEVAEAAGRCLAARDSSSRETLSVLAKAGLLVRPARSLYANPFAWAELPVQERARRAAGELGPCRGIHDLVRERHRPSSQDGVRQFLSFYHIEGIHHRPVGLHETLHGPGGVCR